MGKMRLELDDLRIESFETLGGAELPGGTVYGRGDPVAPSPGADTIHFSGTPGCPGYTNQTCYNSCDHLNGCSFESCPATCPMQGTCYRSCYALQCPVNETAVPVDRG